MKLPLFLFLSLFFVSTAYAERATMFQYWEYGAVRQCLRGTPYPSNSDEATMMGMTACVTSNAPRQRSPAEQLLEAAKDQLDDLHGYLGDSAVIDTVTKAIDLDPRLVEAYLVRAYILWSWQRKPDQALADYERVIELDPVCIPAYYWRHDIFFMTKRWNEVMWNSIKLIELQPLNPGHYYEKARAYENLGWTSEAIKAYKEFLPVAMNASEGLSTIFHEHIVEAQRKIKKYQGESP